MANKQQISAFLLGVEYGAREPVKSAFADFNERTGARIPRGTVSELTEAAVVKVTRKARSGKVAEA